MPDENLVICYEGIQRIYRNAVVRLLRLKLKAAFPQDWEARLRSPFQKEWESIKANALLPRLTGEVACPVLDDFDLLSVNHFFNLFEVYHEPIVGGLCAGTPEERKRQKQALVSWAKTVKHLRDPLSHPSEGDLPREDAFQLLDCARRVLHCLGLPDEAAKIQALIDKILGGNSSLGRQKVALEGRLPPRESIVVGFIGRDKELAELRNWFMDPVTRRWALAGEGGKGKSALAYSLALEIKEEAPQPYQAVFWLSAKKRKFLEGTTISLEAPDFSDLDSALVALLNYYGWIEEINEAIEAKRKRVLELLNEFPSLVVVDDIDSLEVENESVIEFFSLEVPQTRSKVLFTSRRTIFGMGGTTTHIRGFERHDAEAFIRSRCEIMELDPAVFNKAAVQEIIQITEGSPLFIEDLVRLSAVVQPVKEAIRLWGQRNGQEARKYALGRECDLLTVSARKILFGASIWPGPVSFSEIEAVTGASRDVVTAALQELQKLFLAPKPRLIDGDERFEVNLNTRSLVREAYGSSEEYRRILTAYKTISDGVPQFGRGAVSAFIRQAIYLVRASKHREAEELLIKTIQKYDSNPDLIGVLGFIYKTWVPPRLTDAREQFQRAWQLKSKKEEMYEHWSRMEIREHEWTKAAEAAEKGLKILSNSRLLHYLSGYSRARLAKEFQSGLHHGKAQKEISDARRQLEKALVTADQLDGHGRILNAETYRALVLLCETASDLKSMQHFFQLWRNEHPDDPDADSEWVRLSTKYNLEC